MWSTSRITLLDAGEGSPLASRGAQAASRESREAVLRREAANTRSLRLQPQPYRPLEVLRRSIWQLFHKGKSEAFGTPSLGSRSYPRDRDLYVSLWFVHLETRWKAFMEYSMQ